MSKVMRCKLKLHTKGDNPENFNVTMGAVWEGTTEAQAASENAIFGKWTPCAEFKCNIQNPNIFESLVIGQEYYVDFIAAETK
jgi:hypothetical protein